ncbi:Methyl-accepting chemotaxis protein, partial [hydrothermal vent metagenome]
MVSTNHASWWWLSATMSTVFIVILINLWIQMNEYTVDPVQLTDEASAVKYINKYIKEDELKNNAGDEGSTIKIKTGLFIQSLKFSSFSEVNLTGYLWQNYEKWQLDALDLKEEELGVIFPEQINSGSDIEPREVYRVEDSDSLVIGWYFEATLRQAFDYSNYPFDHKTVWVRMWPKSFSKNIILEPDFSAYNSTDKADIFGIENDIVLERWERKNTYFDYKLSSYTTNFGIHGEMGKQNFPELYYNFVVQRKFENAFIVYLLPLFLVAALLFMALLTVSEKEELSTRLGFSASGFIGASSALFFVVMLAHIQLRQQFAGSGIVYIEYFYILMYALLVSATANVYFFSI